MAEAFASVFVEKRFLVKVIDYQVEVTVIVQVCIRRAVAIGSLSQAQVKRLVFESKVAQVFPSKIGNLQFREQGYLFFPKFGQGNARVGFLGILDKVKVIWALNDAIAHVDVK